MHSGLYSATRVPACKAFIVHRCTEVLKVCIYQLTSKVGNSDREHLSIQENIPSIKVQCEKCHCSHLKANCIVTKSEKQNYHILRETKYNKTLYVDVHW